MKIVTRLLPLLCLTTFAALSIGSSLYESATYDEPIHIAAGYVYLHTGSYRMEPSHPPLVRLWSALPLLFQNLNYPEFPQMENFKTHRKFSDAFLNHNLVPTDIILTAARTMIVLLAIGLGVLVVIWSLELFGPFAAMVALIAFCFCPPLLAYSHLVLTDMGAAAMSTLALYLFWRFWQDPTAERVAWAGIGLGLALSAKFSEVLLLPILGATLLYLRATAAPKTPTYRRRDALHLAILYFAAAGAVVLLFYRLSESFNLLRGLWELTHAMNSAWPHFFHGHYQAGAWKWFLLVSFMLKTPLPFLFLIFIGGLVAVQGLYPYRTEAIAWLIIPCAVYLGAASFSSFQVGIRRILFLYPLLSIWIGGAAAALWTSSRTWRVVLCALGVWYIVGAVKAYPNYLSYVNETVGGSSQGYRYFADCNVDLGQGYKAMADYLHEHGITQIYFSGFGAVDPHNYGIQYIPIASSNFYDLPGDAIDVTKQKQVLFVISETNRSGVYYHDHDLFGWLKTRQPVTVLMNSLWIYDITGDADAHEHFARILKWYGEKDLAAREAELAHGG